MAFSNAPGTLKRELVAAFEPSARGELPEI
jgi:hypothetical protein